MNRGTLTSRLLSRSGVVLALAAAGFLALPAGPALALTEAPDQTWRTSGQIRAIVRMGDTMFMGGRFLEVREPSGGKHEASNLAAFDASTGEWIQSFAPMVEKNLNPGNPKIEAMALSADEQWLYLGGNFDTVNGVTVKNFAAVDTATGQVTDPRFTARFIQTVRTILLGPDRIYVGGHFTKVSGQPRPRLAALLPDGSLDPDWTPSASKPVHTLEWAADGQTIFVGGAFQQMNGESRASVARVTPDTGALDPWAIPSTQVGTNIAWDLLATPTRLYGGFGDGPNWAGAYRLDLGPVGSQVWRNNYVGNVQALQFNPTGDRLFVGGHFGTARLQQQQCGRNLRGLIMVNPVTGAIDCSWIPQLEPWGNNYVGVWTLLRTGGQLWVGGKFTKLSGVRQGAFARYTL